MRVVHVAPTREAALRATEPPFMGYQRKMAVLRSDATGGNVPNSFDRSLLRLRTFHEYLADGWALIGTPAEVRDGLQQYLDATGYQRVLLLMRCRASRRRSRCDRCVSSPRRLRRSSRDSTSRRTPRRTREPEAGRPHRAEADGDQEGDAVTAVRSCTKPPNHGATPPPMPLPTLRMP